MKFEYIKPEIAVSQFTRGNIITLSGGESRNDGEQQAQVYLENRKVNVIDSVEFSW